MISHFKWSQKFIDKVSFARFLCCKARSTQHEVLCRLGERPSMTFQTTGEVLAKQARGGGPHTHLQCRVRPNHEVSCRLLQEIQVCHAASNGIAAVRFFGVSNCAQSRSPRKRRMSAARADYESSPPEALRGVVCSYMKRNAPAGVVRLGPESDRARGWSTSG